MLPSSLSEAEDLLSITRENKIKPSTVFIYVCMLIVLFCELKEYIYPIEVATMAVDKNEDKNLQINFDVEVHDIECRNLKVLVFDMFGEEPINRISNDFTYRPIDAKGHVVGVSYRHNEADDLHGNKHLKEQKDAILKEDGKAEVDSDWSSSHDGFKHKSFEHVIQAHDFTLINFFAEWCSHCRAFHPMWQQISRKITGTGEGSGADSMKFEDRDGEKRQVQPIKMNCVDFKAECQKQRIDAFPTIRLYKADGSFSVFDGKRKEDDIIKWIERIVKMKSFGWSKDAEHFEKGCNVRGHLQVPRVPGHLQLMTGEGDQTLNPTMTNLSHSVRHLSFSDPDDGVFHRKRWIMLPNELQKYVSPLDGKKFITEQYHTAYQHYLKVVSVITRKKKNQVAYQFSHTDRIAQMNSTEIPQARFFYDFDPFSVKIHTMDDKKWYDFVVELLGKLGGLVVILHLISSGAGRVATKVTAGTANQAHLGGSMSSSSGAAPMFKKHWD